MSASAKLEDGMSIADFMSWEPGDGLKYQLVDGVTVAMAPAGRTHAAIQGQTVYALSAHFNDNGSLCSVLPEAGVTLTAGTRENVRIPDLLVTCTPPGEIEERLISDPRVTIEILSPSNAVKTWTNVWAYTTIESVLEILVLQTDAITGHLLRRAADRSWPLTPMRVGEQLELQSIGFSTPLAFLYRTTRFGSFG